MVYQVSGINVDMIYVHSSQFIRSTVLQSPMFIHTFRVQTAFSDSQNNDR